jgi:hypothetical protein
MQQPQNPVEDLACYWVLEPLRNRYEKREAEPVKIYFESLLNDGFLERNLSEEPLKNALADLLYEQYVLITLQQSEQQVLRRRATVVRQALKCVFHQLCTKLAKHLTERLAAATKHPWEDFMGWTVTYASDVEGILREYRPDPTRGNLLGWAWKVIERKVKSEAVYGTGYKEKSDIKVFLDAPHAKRQGILLQVLQTWSSTTINGDRLHVLLKQLYVPVTPGGRVYPKKNDLWIQVAHLYQQNDPKETATSIELEQFVNACARHLRKSQPIQVALDETMGYNLGDENEDDGLLSLQEGQQNGENEEESLLQEQEWEQKLRCSWEELPWERKVLFNLCYGLELNQVDVAILMGMPPRNDGVSTRLERSRKKLLYALLQNFLGTELLLPLAVCLWQAIPGNPKASDPDACREVGRLCHRFFPDGVRESYYVHPQIIQILRDLIQKPCYKKLLKALEGQWAITEKNPNDMVEKGKEAGLLQPEFIEKIFSQLVEFLKNTKTELVGNSRDQKSEPPSILKYYDNKIESDCKGLSRAWRDQLRQQQRLPIDSSSEQDQAQPEILKKSLHLWVEAIVWDLNRDCLNEQLLLTRQAFLSRQDICKKLESYLNRRMMW